MILETDVSNHTRKKQLFQWNYLGFRYFWLRLWLSGFFLVQHWETIKELCRIFWRWWKYNFL